MGGTPGPPCSGPDWAKLHPSVCEVTAPPAYFHVTATCSLCGVGVPYPLPAPLSAHCLSVPSLPVQLACVGGLLQSPRGCVAVLSHFLQVLLRGPGVCYRVSWLVRYIRVLSTTLISPGKCISLPNLCRSCEGLPPAVTL